MKKSNFYIHLMDSKIIFGSQCNKHSDCSHTSNLRVCIKRMEKGLAVLRVLEKEQLQENALAVGSYLKNRMKALQDKHEIIGDVRGRGLMLGVELVSDRQLKTPAKDEISRVTDQMKEMEVLIGKGGFHGNVFRITPPLCFTKEDSDFLAEVMDAALSKL